MTTIAWDGTSLAADKASWSGPARRKVRKVFKVKAANGGQFLVAFAGDGAFAMAVLGWMRGQRDRPMPLDFLDQNELKNQFALVIDEQRRVWQMAPSLTYTRMYERIYAFGGGHEFAWGALEAGATARRAVEIAIKRSDYAGLGVDVVRF
jgi:ATP-dependent protease HslVU (ClpYQ) peptidase subunit